MKDYNDKTICLNMIVKNEAHVIQDTLENISKYIDYWVICDTGSTDGTQDLIKAYFRRKGIPGELKQHEWRDFGYNRTIALEECRGKADYIWVIDADDLIVGNIQLPKRMTADVYQLKYGSGFTYCRNQIFGNHLKWKYVGVLHEYPKCISKNNESTIVITGDYYIDSRRLGARNQDPEKYLKDGKILAKAIEKELTGGDKDLAARYAFYAGQSFIDHGDFEEGIKYYQMRIDMGGWFEETYYSYFKIAMAKKSLNYSENDIEKAFLDAYNFLPSRTEPFYELSLYFRLRGNFQKGYRYAKKAIKIPFPVDQKLFIYKDFYDWKAKDEFGICAYYIKEYQECYDVCQELLTEGYLPEDQRLRIEANRDFCVPFLKDELSKYNSNLVKKITKNVKKTKREQVTYSITTCKRFDLFHKTINSFLNCCKDVLQIDRWLCVDDNSNQEDRNKMKKLYPFFEFIWKKPEDKGHPESMNIIIDKVKTPYLLHMEDDWQFFERKDYIKPALEILKENEKLGQVCFNRNYAETLNDREVPGGHLKFSTRSNFRYLIHEHYNTESDEYADFNRRHGGKPSSCYWPHYSLRPSVLRTDIFKKIGRYNENTTHFEMEYSNRYVAKGYKTGFYDSICSLHIGRLTSERDDNTKKNAYELNDESQFGDRDKKTPIQTEPVKQKNINWNEPVEIDLRDLMPSDNPKPIQNKSNENNSDENYDEVMENARRAQQKNIPEGMNTINASPKVKNAIHDIISNNNFTPTVRGSESNDIVEHIGKQFEGYIYFPNKDSMGHDIKHEPNKTEEELKELCDADPNCLGFNTLGYMKHMICDESDFITLPRYGGRNHGLYVNQNHWNQVIDNIIKKLMNHKEPIAVVIKHQEDFEDFQVELARFLFHCKDVESVKTWICLNYNVDCDVQDQIKENYPFIQHVIQKSEDDSLNDILEILKKDNIKHIFSWKDDFCHKNFNIKDGYSMTKHGPHYFQNESKGPYLVKVNEMDWLSL